MPGEYLFDMALYRKVPINEDVYFQVHAEFVNLLNHPILNFPGHSLGSPGFGVISSKQGRRQIQMGFRLVF